MCIIIVWFQWPSWHRLKRDRVWRYIDDSDGEDCVGYIYASKPFNSSLIYYQRLFHSNSTIKHQKQLKYISCIFLVFLLTLFQCHLCFLCYMSYKGLSHLLPFWPFASILTFCFHLNLLIPGQGSTYQHIGSTQRFGRLMVKALKSQVSRYMRVRHTCVCPLSSVSTTTEEVNNSVTV